MTKHGFLKKLHLEGALQLVEPSEEVRTAYLKKSDSYLASAKILIDHERHEESVSMAYYIMYYSVLALFFACGIKCENHTAAIMLLFDIFGIDNTSIKEAKTERIDKQYYVASSPVHEEVITLIRTAESFNAELLDSIERLNREKTDIFRKKCVNFF